MPTSEGWPPPWGWNIVDVVVRTESASVPDLKRARLASARVSKGVEFIIFVLCVVKNPSRWYTGIVPDVSVTAEILLAMILLYFFSMSFSCESTSPCDFPGAWLQYTAIGT